MRQPEHITLLLEQTHPDGTVTQEQRKYTIKVSFEAWLQATRTNLLDRNQRILEIHRHGKVWWREPSYTSPAQPAKPKAQPLF